MAAFETLLFVAPITDSKAIALDVDEDAKHRYPSAWLRNIGDEELVDLWDVVDAESNEGTIMGNLGYASPDGEVMVMTVPETFVTALAAIDVQQIAKEWQSTDLMQAWPLEDVLAVLRELTTLCKRSIELGHPILQVASL